MSKMADFKERCVVIKFSFKGGGESATETFEILCYAHARFHSLHYMKCFRWMHECCTCSVSPKYSEY